ncbi:hypothetical protein L7F22_053377 [Adiantum nelumboides]|nr:hypothetical protein [Adiantum nelumboides]
MDANPTKSQAQCMLTSSLPLCAPRITFIFHQIGAYQLFMVDCFQKHSRYSLDNSNLAQVGCLVRYAQAVRNSSLFFYKIVKVLPIFGTMLKVAQPNAATNVYWRVDLLENFEKRLSSTSRAEADVSQSSVVLKKPKTKLEEKVGGTTDFSNMYRLKTEGRDVIVNGSNGSCLDSTTSLQTLRRLNFQKEYKLAKGRVQELYKKYPNDTSVLMEFAFVEKQLGDLVAAGSLYSKAISAFEHQQNLGYDYVRALQALGSIEFRARNAKRARVLFMESIRAARQAEHHLPDSVSGASVYGLHAWAQLELQQGNWAKARDLLTRAADIQPENAVVHQSRALLEAKAHNWEEARYHFSLAVESAPNDVKCWHAWAIFEASQGKENKMRELFQRALEVDPDSVHCLQAWVHQETLFATLESKDKARSLLQRCTEIEPQSLYAWQIIDQVNDVTFRLDLPPSWKIHNAFHVSLLRPYMGPPPSEPVTDELPEIEEMEEILELEQIVHHQERHLKSGKVTRKYLVKFKNYSALDAQWMTEQDLKVYPEILDGYLQALQLRTTV